MDSLKSEESPGSGSQSDIGENEQDTEQSEIISRKGRKSGVTGRGVTMQMLIDENILDPGNKVLSIDYLRQKFEGDLLSDGQIHWNEQIFSSPSAWAMHCKKMVNPDKKSGCGWASVKYKGKKLDQFKSAWFSKQRLSQGTMLAEPPTKLGASLLKSPSLSDYSATELPHARINEEANNIQSSSKDNISPRGSTASRRPHLTFSEALQVVQSQSAQSTAEQNSSKEHTFTSPTQPYQSPASGKIYKRKPGRPPKDASRPSAIAIVPPPTAAGPGRGRGRKGHRTRVSVKYSTVTTDSDPQTLVECCQFSTTGRIQPFSISISTTCLLLMDFHSHLSTSEVLGYLAGKWDSGQIHLQVLQCYPLRYQHGDKAAAEECEQEIRSSIETQGLNLVGSYHSHPFCQADPTVADIKNQMAHQSVLRDAEDHEPCIGIIVSPYDSYKKETVIKAFWIQTQKDPLRLGLPLLMKFTTQQDQNLTQNIVNEMVALVNFYKGANDSVRFTDAWIGETTYLDKIKHSVIRKFPQDQTDGRFLDFIHKMLAAISGLRKTKLEEVLSP